MAWKSIAILLALAAFACAASRVPVVVASGAAPEEKLAAEELVHYLARIYPGQAFEAAHAKPARGPAILISRKRNAVPESFTVSHSADTATIAGADARGTLYGVYALLEKLGCGFYLSGDTLPAPRKGPISFDGWQLADAPLYPDRIVFDWHNFLSSASTWEFEDWQRYINQAAKMRFNTIMVHAYGNNPMFQFSFNGETKPVGYLATTERGRDWGTQHVNDVRRIIGGEIFHSPVFGASVAMVAEERRSEAATALMKKVFAYARSRGMHVTFALDVDTESANPQNIIKTLPSSARLIQGNLQLANPDTPEGYAYYQAEARQLLETYPQIDRLAVWFRGAKTPWLDLTPKEFPADWRKEFEGGPSQGKDTAGIFAVSKLVRAFGKALRDLGRQDVELATGSWRLEFVRPADHFMPREATIIPLDWNTGFDTEKEQEQLKGLTPGRKLIPIVWAHHDDRTYVGRSYTPYRNFATLLKQSASSGFGIIHWTTRPLDLYFKSTSAQVWEQTQNQPLEVACREMAGRFFGESVAKSMAEYLLKWVTEAPMFGRETRDLFMDHPLENPEATIAGCRARLDLLSRVDDRSLAPDARDRFQYFRDFERFMLAFHESQSAWERAGTLMKNGAVTEARTEIRKADAEAVIRMYGQAAAHGKISRGEEALLITLNLRWLPYVISRRQALGLEPVRIKFAPTQHEALAQSPGANTFYVDEQRQFWKTLGEKETGQPVSEAGIRLEKPFRIHLAPITGDKLVAGRYTVALQLRATEAAPIETVQRDSVAVSSGALELKVDPMPGKKFLAGAILTAVGGSL